MAKTLLSKLRHFPLMLVFTILMHPSKGQSTTYSCTGVDKKANLGIESNASVSVSSHDKICDFAVNGVSPTGKQSAEFVNAMNGVLGGQASWNSMGESTLVSLLVAPFLSDQTDPDLARRFRNSFGADMRDMGSCIANFQRNPDGYVSSPINRNDLICRVVQPNDRRRTYDDLSRFGMIEAQVDQSTLQIGVILDQKTYLLFIPARLIRAGLNGYRLRAQ